MSAVPTVPLAKVLYTAKVHTTGGRDVAQAVVDAAHRTYPYSKATRGNIEVAINLSKPDSGVTP